jgi:ABC transport system ATP-binding/permease protein
MHKLVISDDEGKTTVVPLVRDELTIGRKEGNAVRLTERNVSRRHARIKRDGDGFIVEDLDSYNGVSLNDERIQGQARLKPGDRLRIGDYRFALDADGAAPTADAGGNIDLDFGGDDLAVAPSRLVMLTPPAAGAVYAVGDGMRLGRAEDLEIWVNHRSISREHVRFVERDGELVVEDLSSANGITVNGYPCASASLSSGDVLGLGQVRFRFVPRGEDYQFEPEASQEEKEAAKNGRVQALGIIAALLVVLGVVALFVLSSGDDDVAQVAADESSVQAREASAPEPEPGPSPEEILAAERAVEECERQLSEDRVAEALEAADRALLIMPDHEGAAGCRADASDIVQERAAFARGKAALEAGRVEDAYFAFESLDEQSALRDQPEVVRARRLFAEQRLGAAKRALRKDPQLAHDEALQVLMAPGMPTLHQAEANRLVEAAKRRGAVAANGEREGAAL